MTYKYFTFLRGRRAKRDCTSVQRVGEREEGGKRKKRKEKRKRRCHINYLSTLKGNSNEFPSLSPSASHASVQ